MEKIKWESHSTFIVPYYIHTWCTYNIYFLESTCTHKDNYHWIIIMMMQLLLQASLQNDLQLFVCILFLKRKVDDDLWCEIRQAVSLFALSRARKNNLHTCTASALCFFIIPSNFFMEKKKITLICQGILDSKKYYLNQSPIIIFQ